MVFVYWCQFLINSVLYLMQGSNKEILCQLSMLERRMAPGKKIFCFPLFFLSHVMLMKMILRRARKQYVSEVECLSFCVFTLVNRILCICLLKLMVDGGCLFLACDLCVHLDKIIKKLKLTIRRKFTCHF